MAKKERASKHKGLYEAQKGRTGRNKLRQLTKRARKLEKWVKIGKKKNGKPVLSMEDRKARLAKRKEALANTATNQRREAQINRIRNDQFAEDARRRQEQGV